MREKAEGCRMRMRSRPESKGPSIVFLRRRQARKWRLL
jgi:hypothetical protein